jgi:beta-glucosidase
MDWGRLQPEQNSFNVAALERYEKLVDKLLKLNIIPMLTLHHFTHPGWFHKRTPWIDESSIGSFANFTEKIIQRFYDKIPFFITFNEPVVWGLAAYGDGKFPPGEKNLAHMALALKHMLLAHKRAYEIIKSHNSKIQIGIANNFISFQAERSWNLLDRGLTFLIHRLYNLSLPSAFLTNRLKIYFPLMINFQTDIPLNNQIDFWGINYYYRMHLRFQPHWTRPLQMNFLDRSGNGLSDLGWEIYPQGLWEVMEWLKATGKPFLVTENGIADADDCKRKEFIQAHLALVKKAVQAGLPLKGYFYWSLLDNYEWLEGLNARFGLYDVDYANQCQRKLRKSGEWYSQINPLE